MTIAIGFTVLAIALTFGSTFLQAIGRVRFSLRDMMLMVLSAGACVSLVVTARTNAEMLGLGLFGMVVWVAVLISAVARASMSVQVRASDEASDDISDDTGEPPHGPESDR